MPDSTPPNLQSSARKYAAMMAILALIAVTAGAIYYTLTPGPGKVPDHTGKPPETGASAGADRATIDTILQNASATHKNGSPAAAEAILDEAIRKYPGERDFYVMKAQILTGRDNAAAYDVWTQAIQLAQSAGDSGEAVAAYHYQAGNLAMILGNLDRAEEHYSQAQASNPRDADYPQALAQVYTRQLKWPEARAQLHLSIKIDPNRAKAWANLAEIELQSPGGSTDMAVQHIAKARALEPKSSLWRLIEARALNRATKPQDALTTLGGLPEGERFQLPVLRLMGESYGMLHKPADAAELFKRASDADPKDPDIAFEAAVWAERAGQPKDAAALASRAAALGHEGGKKMQQRLADAGDGSK